MANTTVTELAPDGYYTLAHPKHEDVTVRADVIGLYKNAGRTVGLELQFPGEAHTRRLRFAEIRRLMLIAIAALLAE